MALRLALWVLGLALAIAPLGAQSRSRLAPYFPSPAPVVDKMLEICELKPGEVLYDVGSGDGRIVIAAAQRYGVRAIGYEIDAQLVDYSRGSIDELELGELASIEQADLLTADFSMADVVTVYLLPSSNEQLRPLLEKQLKKGARVVTHDFPFEVWEPVKEVSVVDTTARDARTHMLYLYRR